MLWTYSFHLAYKEGEGSGCPTELGPANPNILYSQVDLIKSLAQSPPVGRGVVLPAHREQWNIVSIRVSKVETKAYRSELACSY